MAIGARSQAAKTYLERKLEDFPGNGKDELIMHALSALQVCTRLIPVLTSVAETLSHFLPVTQPLLSSKTMG
jgi:hypothetical protein